jgi:hypothetical protein
VKIGVMVRVRVSVSRRMEQKRNLMVQALEEGREEEK